MAKYYLSTVTDLSSNIRAGLSDIDSIIQLLESTVSEIKSIKKYENNKTLSEACKKIESTATLIYQKRNIMVSDTSSNEQYASYLDEKTRAAEEAASKK